MERKKQPHDAAPPPGDYGTRTFLELSVGVGSTHTIEAIVHLSSKNVDWWNANISTHEKQLFKIIQRQILPKECSEDVPKPVIPAKQQQQQQQQPKASVAMIGERNEKEKKRREAREKLNGKRKRIGTDVTNNYKNKSSSSTSKKEILKKDEEAGNSSSDVTFLFGDSIQIAYRVEDKSSTADNATLRFHSSQNQKSSTCFQLKTIPKRIRIWCYPFDSQNPSQCSEEGGFLRPEFIPIASIFRLSGKGHATR